jgi:hypothetical protein
MLSTIAGPPSSRRLAWCEGPADYNHEAFPGFRHSLRRHDLRGIHGSHPESCCVRDGWHLSWLRSIQGGMVASLDRIRTHGFRRWYERQLIECHAWLVSWFLGVIVLVSGLEVAGNNASRLMGALLLLGGLAVTLYSWKRYHLLLEVAERLGEQAVCPGCQAYGKFKDRVLRAGALARWRRSCAGKPWRRGLVARQMPQVRRRMDDQVALGHGVLADGVRFELTEGLHLRRFSRPVHSTALPPIHRAANFNSQSKSPRQIWRSPACASRRKQRKPPSLRARPGAGGRYRPRCSWFRGSGPAGCASSAAWSGAARPPAG